MLTDGSSLHQTGSFYLAPKKYTEANPQFIQQVLTVLTQANALTKTDREQSIKLLSQSMGLPEKVVASYLDHLPDLPITPVSAEQKSASSKPPICSMRITFCLSRSRSKTASGNRPFRLINYLTT